MKIVRHTTLWLPSRNSIGVQMVPGMGLMSVLTVGQREDYAAYQGIISDSSLCKDKEERHQRAVEWVASNGDKMLESAARAMFHELEGKEYRL